MTRVTPALILVLLVMPTAPVAAQDDHAAGLFTEAGQLPLVGQSVVVRIHGGEAQIELHQVFANAGPEIAQADFRLHLPDGAVVTGFGFWSDGRFLSAELKEREQARRDHAAAAHTGRPTGLLQRDGRIHSFSVYPVLAGGLQEVRTTVVLPVVTERGRAHIRLPLDSFLGHARLSSSVVVHLETAEALRDLGINGAGFEVKRRDSRHAELVLATEDPVEIWWAPEAPPLLSRAEAVPLDGGSSAVQLRLALNDLSFGGPGATEIVLLIDASASMRRRGTALSELVDRVLDQATAPVRVIRIADVTREISGADRRALHRRLRSSTNGFSSHWDDVVAAADDVSCASPATRCVVITDPQIPGLPAERELETFFLADADELAHFGDVVQRSAPVFQPGVEPTAKLLALTDELVLPVLELRSVRQDGVELEPVGDPRRRVAAGGLMRVFFDSHSDTALTLELAVDDRVHTREVAIEPLDPLTRLGRSIRRGFFRGRLDDWMADYRRTRDPALREQIVEISLRETIPTALTSLHVASPDRVMARTATPAPLLRRLGVVLLLLGGSVLIYGRRWTS